MHHVDEMSVPHTLTTVESQSAVWIAGGNLARHEAVGEAYNPEQMRRIVASVHGRTDVVLPAWLVPEPQNPHDPQAVWIWMLGGKVGYLPRELAAQWSPILARFRARYDLAVACQAQIDPPSAANQGGFGVAVWLPALPAAHPSVPRPPPPVAARPAVAVSPRPAPAAPPSEQLSKTLAALAAAKKELESVEEALEVQSFGFYRPRYGFESSAEYVARLKAIKDEQQALIKTDKAAP
ncbi:HIRAN domain-containing protein [Pendulispora albinea]|uniref:HIRAN domain-containing protein n=1 Tax=Pendulispora albinea TaxID=2741071 RepID=A0ABZ2M7D7_9BACT